jgi:long-chain acyl-CoA synthetase
MAPSTIPALLQERALQNPEKIYLYFGNIEVSYKELNSITNRVARGLVSLGLRPGDKLCVMLPNCPEYVYLFLGAPKAGITLVPLNTALKQDELAFITDNSDARAFVTTPSFLDLANKIRAASELIVVGGEKGTGDRAFAELLEEADEAIDYSTPDSLASIVYTSGTTGRPKGVMLTQSNYINNCRQSSATLEMKGDERAMCILPLFHVNGQVASILSPLQAGASLILTEGLSPRTFFDNLTRYSATSFSGVPTIYSILLNLPDREKYDLSSLRRCVCGAAPMPVELFTQFEQAFNTIIIEGYGLSEGTCVSTLNPIEGKRKIGSIGLPLKGQEVKIFDNEDRELGPNEIGEIVVRGPNMMAGYYKNEAATAETLRNGWLHTGDLGKRDEDGYIYIVGRKKEMIIRGGENIYPKEIEEALYRHAAIKEAAVIGLPHKIWGEEVGAAIILKDGAQASGDDIIAYCRAHLADYKCPSRIFFCEQFPKTATGKIQKNRLIEQLLNS